MIRHRLTGVVNTGNRSHLDTFFARHRTLFKQYNENIVGHKYLQPKVDVADSRQAADDVIKKTLGTRTMMGKPPGYFIDITC